MGLYADEIIAACQRLGCNCKLLTSTEAAAIHTGIERRFTRQANGAPLWERLHSDSSIYDKNGWKLIQNFTSGEPLLIFFEWNEDQSFIMLEAGANLTAILADCVGFVFYVANATFDYLFCFNDHDFLIAVGLAAEWITYLKQ